MKKQRQWIESMGNIEIKHLEIWITQTKNIYQMFSEMMFGGQYMSKTKWPLMLSLAITKHNQLHFCWRSVMPPNITLFRHRGATDRSCDVCKIAGDQTRWRLKSFYQCMMLNSINGKNRFLLINIGKYKHNNERESILLDKITVNMSLISNWFYLNFLWINNWSIFLIFYFLGNTIKTVCVVDVMLNVSKN